LLLRRIGTSLLILIAIAFLSLIGLDLAKLGRSGTAVTFTAALSSGIHETWSYFIHHPEVYVWHKAATPWLKVVWGLFLNSTGLLMTALALATLLGVAFGVLAAVLRRKAFTPFMFLVSILGISTPSFFLAMMLWAVNVYSIRVFDIVKAPLPPTGTGWDLHLVMPALVLAARPFAQIMQVTYINLSQVLEQEYIRAAQARGVGKLLLLTRHALRNTLIGIFTSMSTSLRFMLSSLPVVEAFFVWEGMGAVILRAITEDMPTLATDLVVACGLLFLLVNLLLEFLFPWVDARLRKDNLAAAPEDASLNEDWLNFRETFTGWWVGLRESLVRLGQQRFELPFRRAARLPEPPELTAMRKKENRRILRAALTNPALLVGSAIVVGLILLAIFGGQLTPASPYATQNLATIDGKITAPPFKPSYMFPWGSDVIGRDVQALVLSGARQTLAMAFFATLARVALGVLLGMLAGWRPGGWLDKVLKAIVAVWAAFPTTLFAAIIILALGIQSGMSVFIIALCLVGWTEIAQYVRGQVISQKPQLYVEAARSVGARQGEILFRHILPHLLPSVLVLGVLEMGGVLMLLSELGFLNIFLGGGFRVEIGDVGRSSVHFFYSDVPEWGALLANIRAWWRSYPWMAWAPGVFFFASILSFNLWGEGLRRFLEESRINLTRFINRYSALALAAVLIIASILLRSAAPVELYRSQAAGFNEERALADIAALSAPEMMGRETGLPQARLAADYIADQMEEIGLLPGGNKETYIQSLLVATLHLSADTMPTLALADGSHDFAYRSDFVETVINTYAWGDATGQVVGLAVGVGEGEQSRTKFKDESLEEKVLLIREADLTRVELPQSAGVLIVTDRPEAMEKKYLYQRIGWLYMPYPVPILLITPQTADALLAPAGESVAGLSDLAASLQPGEVGLTEPAASVTISIPVYENQPPDEHYNVIGYIPGSGAQTRLPTGESLDSQVIVVSAYYDGLGVGPDGTLYPGANDNASGVATMLEIARLLKEGNFEPKKTVVFVAWTGGEHAESLSIKNVMNAKAGFGLLTVEAVVELSGVGGGIGNGLVVEEGSSFRLANLVKDAGAKFNTPVSARGRGPHADMVASSGFGGRSALSAYLSWDGSDVLAHTPRDTVENIEPASLKKAGQTAALLVTILSREIEY
jgi:peptide/nickel transport system permease protein